MVYESRRVVIIPTKAGKAIECIDGWTAKSSEDMQIISIRADMVIAVL